jgi:hypothetical protein
VRSAPTASERRVEPSALCGLEACYVVAVAVGLHLDSSICIASSAHHLEFLNRSAALGRDRQRPLASRVFTPAAHRLRPRGQRNSLPYPAGRPPFHLNRVRATRNGRTSSTFSSPPPSSDSRHSSPSLQAQPGINRRATHQVRTVHDLITSFLPLPSPSLVPRLLNGARAHSGNLPILTPVAVPFCASQILNPGLAYKLREFSLLHFFWHCDLLSPIRRRSLVDIRRLGSGGTANKDLPVQPGPGPWLRQPTRIREPPCLRSSPGAVTGAASVAGHSETPLSTCRISLTSLGPCWSTLHGHMLLSFTQSLLHIPAAPDLCPLVPNTDTPQA